jgi:hypothetical protein
MISKLILFLFIILFISIMLFEVYSQSSPLIEGFTADQSSSGGSDGDLGVTVGRYTSKIDQLGKTVDSMQATILGLLPTVSKNTQDNAKNQQAIQSIIANKDKT